MDIINEKFHPPRLIGTPITLGGIASICFKSLSTQTQICQDQDQKFCENFKNTHCQVEHPAIKEYIKIYSKLGKNTFYNCHLVVKNSLLIDYIMIYNVFNIFQ